MQHRSLERCIMSIPSILGDEKSNSIIPHGDVITAFSAGAFVRGIASQREKRKGEKNANISGWRLRMVAVFKHRISTLMARPFRRRTCAFYRRILSSRPVRTCRGKKRGNTYDFIILTLIHIHRAATYVPLFIGPYVWCSPRRGVCAKRHSATGGGINYLSCDTAKITRGSLLPKKRDFAFRMRSLRSTLWARGECRVPFLSRAADSQPACDLHTFLAE